MVKPKSSTASPKKPKAKVKEQPKNFPIIILGVIGILVLGSIVGYFGFEYRYKDKVYPGVQLHGESLAGMTYSEVAAKITAYKDSLETTGLVYTYGDTTLTIDSAITVEDNPAEVVPLVQIETDATAQAIFGIGRSKSSVDNLKAKLKSMLRPTEVDVRYTLDRATISAMLESEFAQYEVPYVNADVMFVEDNSISFTSHSDGQRFDWETILDDTEQHVAQLEPASVNLELVADPAPVLTSAAELYREELQTIIALVPLTLIYEDSTYEVTSADLHTWLTVTESGVDLDTEAVDTYLDTIAGEIDVPVKEGRFSLDIVDEVVQLTQFQNGENGLGVNVEKTTEQLREAILENHETTIPLVVEITEPRATPDNLDDLGIKELLGTGETSFAGSPANRRFNIQKGADLLNGLLIAPGEEFSLLSVLSPIDLAHGWLSELVIKGDKLEKEAGGGLCQIGSTVFRATLNSGLDVTERRNHSWAVSYYNYNGKAGVDATIYEPSPDYKFVNDTDHWVLIRSRIEGSYLYFDFWGTSDGRKGYFTEPVNYGYVSPGATEEEVDESLPPGTRNCVQHAYTGVSASFDYVIERPDGTKDIEPFTSTYRARPEKCIVGPPEEDTEETAEEDTDGTTDDDVDDTADDTITDDTSNNNENVNSNTNENTNTNSNTNKNTNKKKNKKD